MASECGNCRVLSDKVEDLKTTIAQMEKQRIHLMWTIWLLVFCTILGTVIGFIR
jgi:hypothetical protein